MFYNYTTEDFQITWNGHPYTFKAGQVYDKLAIADDGIKNVELTPGVCETFAHHLATKVLNAPELNVNFTYDKEGNAHANDVKQMRTYNYPNLLQLKERALTPPSADVNISELIKNLPLMGGKAEEPKKVGRPKKVEEPAVV